jgi:PAS domain S-box-containing protein
VDNQVIQARFGVMLGGLLAEVDAVAAHAVLALDEAHGHLINARVVVASSPSERWNRLLGQFKSKAAMSNSQPTGLFKGIGECNNRFARDLLVVSAAFLAAEANDLENHISLLVGKCQQTRICALLEDIVDKVGDTADALIGRVDNGTWNEFFNADRAAFAQRWADVISGTNDMCIGRDALEGYLLGFAQQLIDGGLAAEFDPSAGRRVGADMVAERFTGTETLSKTLALLAEELPNLLGSATPDVAVRVTQLTGNVAAGYVGALHKRSLDEQDLIRVAMGARRKAEQALATREAQFCAVFSKVSSGIGIADLEGNIVDANPALLKMFGYTHEEFSKLNLTTMICSEEVGGLRGYEELVRGERDQFRIQKKFYHRDGNEILTDVTVSLVRDECKTPTYQVALLEDVPNRRHRHARLGHQAYHAADRVG